MTDRFSPRPIVRAHVKALQLFNYRESRPSGSPDWIARGVVWVVPLGVGVACFLLDGSVSNPDGLLAGASLLAAGFVMSFSQMAAWRDRLTARQATNEASEVANRDSLDEAVAHIFVAMYLCFALAGVIVVGGNFADSKGSLVSGWAAAAASLGTAIVVLVTVVLPKLYIAYATTNKVPAELSGIDDGPPER